MNETWLRIPGFHDYAVSSLGQVKRILPAKSRHATSAVGTVALDGRGDALLAALEPLGSCRAGDEDGFGDLHGGVVWLVSSPRCG